MPILLKITAIAASKEGTVTPYPLLLPGAKIRRAGLQGD